MKKIICTLIVLAFCSAVFSAARVAEGHKKQQRQYKPAEYTFTALSLFSHLDAE